MESGEHNDYVGFLSEVDVFLLYLLSRNKIEEAREVAEGTALKGFISRDVGQLLLANVASTKLMKRKNPSSMLSSYERRAQSIVDESLIR